MNHKDFLEQPASSHNASQGSPQSYPQRRQERDADSPDTDAADGCIHWKLKPFLQQHKISAYALAQKLSGRLSSNTVYALVRETPKRVDLDSLGVLIPALRAMTGERVRVEDLLEYRD